MAELAALDAAMSSQNDRPEGLSELYAQACAVSGSRNTVATFETVFTSEGHPFDSIRPRGVASVERVESGPNVFLHLRDHEGQWVVGAFPTQFPGVFELASGLPATHRQWRNVSNWVAASSTVSRCYLDHDDFSAIGDRLSEFGDVEVVRMSARKLEDGSAVNRSFKQRENRLRPSHLDLIEETEDFGASVRTLELMVSSTMHVHVRRLAGATLYSGDFGVFADQVLTRLEEATARRKGLLSGRARRPQQTVRPVSVFLPLEMLNTPAETGELLTITKSLPDVSVAVFHRNPYLHFAATDERDGSNFDVMVTRPDRIDLYPGYRASATALARVAQYLGEWLGAVAIADPPPVEPVSLDDLRAPVG